MRNDARVVQAPDRPVRPVTPAPSRGPRAPLTWLLAVGVPTAALALHMALYGRWLVDDAGITFAYARSIAAGAGPVLQPGAAPVEGWSNPSWLALLVLASAVGLFDHGTWFGVSDLVLFPKAAALACGAGVVAAFHVVAREVVPGRWRAAAVTAVAGTLVAAVPSYAAWLASGLENPLLALGAAAIAATLVRAVARGRLTAPGPAVTCGLLAALAALTRPDGLVYAVAYPVALLVLLRRDTIGRAVAAAGLSLLVFAVPYGGYLAWRVATFGLWVPNTAVAKAQGLPEVTALNRPAELVPVAGWLLVSLAAGALGAALLRPGRHRPLLAVLLVPFGLALAAYAVLEPDWMGLQRFATPIWALGALVAVLAADRAIGAATVRGRAVAGGLGVVALVVSAASWLETARTFRNGPTVPLCAIAVGMGAAPNAFGDILGVPDGRIATPDVGGTALTSRYEVVDLVGLVSAPIARFHADGDMAGLRDHVLDEVAPEFVEVHGNWTRMTGLLDDPRTAERYVPVHMVSPDSGYLVRRDLVTDPARLAEASTYAREVTQPRREAASAAPRSGCGTLRPGSTDALTITR
ncbi:hypothetical protein SAMN05216207_100252 [Pseudonocardia ammonioxydans]|uniref:4-amino-4-deoxy-L-arabinose transferase n=1 Tax=Pseudonocardia ammonioxydans TaxID=260086 RepID=A0A1I4T211_PSUAM|nr:hypothetical protein SAMN05216207_100252 [Pseudonocardia ammonioxydans]